MRRFDKSGEEFAGGTVRPEQEGQRVKERKAKKRGRKKKQRMGTKQGAGTHKLLLLGRKATTG